MRFSNVSHKRRKEPGLIILRAILQMLGARSQARDRSAYQRPMPAQDIADVAQHFGQEDDICVLTQVIVRN